MFHLLLADVLITLMEVFLVVSKVDQLESLTQLPLSLAELESAFGAAARQQT